MGDSSISKKIKLSKRNEDGSNSASAKSAFATIQVYICPTTFGPKRLAALEKSATQNGFTLSKQFGPGVTHVITDLPSTEVFMREPLFKKIKAIDWKGHVCESKWLLECIKTNSIVSESAFHLQQENCETSAPAPVLDKDFDLEKFNSCVPERKSNSENLNGEIIEGLDFLANYWKLCRQSMTDERKALAFGKAAAAIRCLPFKVTHSEQLQGIKDLGCGHALRVATQILENSQCEEVEEKKIDQKYISIKVFCQIYGIGPSIAQKWFALGLRTMEDVRSRFGELDVTNNRMVLFGIAFYDDLNTPVLLGEAQKTFDFIKGIAQQRFPSVVASLNGGFRRGKSSGHDVDILFSYPEHDFDGDNFVLAVRDELDKRGLIAWSQSSGVDGSHDKPIDAGPSGTMTPDHLPLCMLILKYPLDGLFDKSTKHNAPAGKEFDPFELAGSKREWRAIRVDLIGSTTAQYPFAQVGWTGNKQYNRLLRQYAKDSLGYSLSSTGLYDIKQHRWISAQTERDVFQHLKISYREPWERNF